MKTIPQHSQNKTSELLGTSETPIIIPSESKATKEGVRKIVQMCEASGDRQLVHLGKLIMRKGDVNVKDSDGGTVLMSAADTRSLEMIRLLLARPEILVNEKDNSGVTALMYACSPNDLRTPIPEEDNRSRHKRETYEKEIHEREIEICKLLLARPEILVNEKAKNGGAALGYAISAEKTEIAELLLTRPEILVNLGKYNGYLGTPLAEAAYRGLVGIVKLLLARPEILVNEKSYDEGTPLIWATKGGGEKARVEIVTLLLARPEILVNEKNNNGDTALLGAIMSNGRGVRVEITKLLLARPDILVNEKNNDGWTALLLAIRGNGRNLGEDVRIEIVKLLLARPDILVNEKNNDGWTALLLAASNYFIEIVKLLLARPDILVNEKNNDGDTALKCATANKKQNYAQNYDTFELIRSEGYDFHKEMAITKLLLIDPRLDLKLHNQGKKATKGTCTHEIRSLIREKMREQGGGGTE